MYITTTPHFLSTAKPFSSQTLIELPISKPVHIPPHEMIVIIITQHTIKEINTTQTHLTLLQKQQFRQINTIKEIYAFLYVCVWSIANCRKAINKYNFRSLILEVVRKKKKVWREGEGSPIEVEAEGSLGFEAAKGRRTIGVGGSRRAVGAESTKGS